MMNTLRYITFWGLCFISTMVLALPTDGPRLITHSELTRLILGLLFVLLVIVLLSWIVKRFNVVHLSSSKGFQLVASMMLGPKEKVVLLNVGGHYLLIGVGTGSITKLYDFGETLPDAFDSESKPTFAELLKSAVGKSK